MIIKPLVFWHFFGLQKIFLLPSMKQLSGNRIILRLPGEIIAVVRVVR